MDKSHRYSYSQLEQIDSCPYSYYLQRIQGVDQCQNAFAQQGSLIHDLLDKWGKREILKDDLVKTYEQRYPKQVTANWPGMLVAKGYARKAFNLGVTYFSEFDEFAGYQIIETQQKFQTEIAGRPFIGIIDMIMRDKKTGQLIILDHKSKSLKAFKKEQNHMYRQQLIYSKFLKQKYGEWPDTLMFNLFKQGGIKKSRPFSLIEYQQTILWATQQIEKIESYELMDWFTMKDPDFFCQQLCSVRKSCPNSKIEIKSKKDKR